MFQIDRRSVGKRSRAGGRAVDERRSRHSGQHGVPVVRHGQIVQGAFQSRFGRISTLGLVSKVGRDETL